jgi:multicomponent Na+:H+ antiporter subunit G
VTAAALAFAGLGVALLLVSAIGLFRLPDALARQHAATKSTTLAVGLVLLGVALHRNELAVWLRVALLLGFLVFTLPIAAHLLARAAIRERYRPEELRDADRVDPG